MIDTLSRSVEAARVKAAEQRFDSPYPSIKVCHECSTYSVRSSIELPTAEPYSKEAHEAFRKKGFRYIVGITESDLERGEYIVTTTLDASRTHQALQHLAECIQEGSY